MLTGQNHHSNGIGCISELAQGFPGYHPVMPPTNGMLSEILKERGFATFAVGKWHLTPTKEVTMAVPFDRWPLGRGRRSLAPPARGPPPPLPSVRRRGRSAPARRAG